MPYVRWLTENGIPHELKIYLAVIQWTECPLCQKDILPAETFVISPGGWGLIHTTCWQEMS